jgi:hypothetical protein
VVKIRRELPSEGDRANSLCKEPANQVSADESVRTEYPHNFRRRHTKSNDS